MKPFVKYWSFLPEGLLCSRPTRGYQIKNVWISVCVSVCPMSVVWCNAPRMTTIAGFLQDYNSILVYFCVFHRALLGGVLSNWCSCALRTWRMWRFRIWEIAGFVQDCMIWARLLNTIALRATLPCRCNLVKRLQWLGNTVSQNMRISSRTLKRKIMIWAMLQR